MIIKPATSFLILFQLLLTNVISCQYQYFIQVSCSDLLPDGYYKMKSPTNETVAHLQAMIFSIGDVNIRDQTIVIKLTTLIDWIDNRLPASQKLMDYVDKRIDPKYHECFWMPFIRTINMAGEREVEKLQTLLLLSKDGRVMTVNGYKFLAACPMDLTWYPLDVQNCWMGFVTWKRDESFLKWSMSSEFNDTMRHESAYDVTISRDDKCFFNPRQSSCLRLKLKFKRRLGMFLMTVYFPSSLIVITSFISFWIDPLSVPGRVTLTVTSLLALMTQFISVRDPLADVNRVTAIDVWFMGCIYLVALTMFEFALNHFLAFKRSSSVMKLIDASNERSVEKEIPICFKMRYKLRNANYDSMSRLLFPLIFAVYSAVYWIILFMFSSG